MKHFKREVSILGQIYSVSYSKKNKYCDENNCDGYTNWIEKKIKVRDSGVPEFDKKVLRHELIHAHMFESGLCGSEHVKPLEVTHDEQMIDWFAVQMPKILEVCEELGCI